MEQQTRESKFTNNRRTQIAVYINALINESIASETLEPLSLNPDDASRFLAFDLFDTIQDKIPDGHISKKLILQFIEKLFFSALEQSQNKPLINHTDFKADTNSEKKAIADTFRTKENNRKFKKMLNVLMDVFEVNNETLEETYQQVIWSLNKFEKFIDQMVKDRNMEIISSSDGYKYQVVLNYKEFDFNLLRDKMQNK